MPNSYPIKQNTRLIKLNKLDFQNELNATSVACSGWLLRFDTSNGTKLVLTPYPQQQLSIYDIHINLVLGSPFTIVDSTLNEVNSINLSGVFSPIDINSFQKGKPNFFFLNKADLYNMYPHGDTFFISKLILDYGLSALFTLPNPDYAPYQDGMFPAMKIETVRLNPLPPPAPTINPIQAKYIIAPPCPPEWNPAFFNLSPSKPI